ncbi:MFS general substrate transporter [Auriscalpium vulgare]|uniref:MFS general substrate transporter n=1 Tax=Auriscalpium vulgare TaxID=40419 RepID=A0ACB8S801_9AGAM|nr:MFS general substrate transporter [Auriscalpium vulgare]
MPAAFPPIPNCLRLNKPTNSTSMTTLQTIPLTTLTSSVTPVFPPSGGIIGAGHPEDGHREVASLSHGHTEAAGLGTITSPVEDPINAMPDGGYGWVIVGACSIIMSFSVGVVYSWGVIQARLTASHLASDATLSFVGSTAASFVAFAALVNVRLIRLLGTRNAALVGSFLLGLGQILSGWSTGSVGGLFVTNGVVMGFGVSLSFMACSSLPAQYFDRRRGLANGFVFAGGGIGGGIWSMSINSLIDRVGIPWTFRILGFLTWSLTLPASMVLRERTRRASAHIDWRLFVDKKFILLFVGSGLATFPLLVPPFFIPLYARSLGVSSLLASGLLAIFNLSSAVGRVGFGMLCDKIGPISSLSLALTLSALSMLSIWPVSASIAPLVVFIVLNGASNGGFFSTVPSVVGHMYGPTRVSGAFAMVLTGWAFGYFLVRPLLLSPAFVARSTVEPLIAVVRQGAPVAGWILDAYGGSDAGRTAFRPAMYYAGSMSLVSAALIVCMRHAVSSKFFAFA